MRTTHVCALCFAHTPLVVHRAFNTAPTKRLQQGQWYVLRKNKGDIETQCKTSTRIKPQHDPPTMHSLNSSSARRSYKSFTSATVFSGILTSIGIFRGVRKVQECFFNRTATFASFRFWQFCISLMSTLSWLVVEAHCTETLHQTFLVKSTCQIKKTIQNTSVTWWTKPTCKCRRISHMCRRPVYG